MSGYRNIGISGLLLFAKSRAKNQESRQAKDLFLCLASCILVLFERFILFDNQKLSPAIIYQQAF